MVPRVGREHLGEAQRPTRPGEQAEKPNAARFFPRHGRVRHPPIYSPSDRYAPSPARSHTPPTHARLSDVIGARMRPFANDTVVRRRRARHRLWNRHQERLDASRRRRDTLGRLTRGKMRRARAHRARGSGRSSSRDERLVPPARRSPGSAWLHPRHGNERRWRIDGVFNGGRAAHGPDASYDARQRPARRAASVGGCQHAHIDTLPDSCCSSEPRLLNSRVLDKSNLLVILPVPESWTLRVRIAVASG